MTTKHSFNAWQENNGDARRDTAVNTLRDVCDIAEAVESMPSAEAVCRIARIARTALERLGERSDPAGLAFGPDETVMIGATVEDEPPF